MICQSTSLDRKRPYGTELGLDGTPREGLMIEGMTTRDMQDCMLRALAQCSDDTELQREAADGEDGDLHVNFLYRANQFDFGRLPDAFMLEIEKAMYAHPNIVGMDDDPRRHPTVFNDTLSSEQKEAHRRRMLGIAENGSLWSRIRGWFK